MKSDAAASNTNDLFKAFTDYTIFTDGLRDRNGTLMNWSQWLANQIYVFKTHQTMNSTNGTVYVTVNLSAAMTTPTSVMVLGLYDEYLSLTYDEYARITEIKKDAMTA